MSEYFVYYCDATYSVPYAHWKFIPTTTPQHLLPDIRFARPVYTWSSVTNLYVKVCFAGSDGGEVGVMEVEVNRAGIDGSSVELADGWE